MTRREAHAKIRSIKGDIKRIARTRRDALEAGDTETVELLTDKIHLAKDAIEAIEVEHLQPSFHERPAFEAYECTYECTETIIECTDFAFPVEIEYVYDGDEWDRCVVGYRAVIDDVKDSRTFKLSEYYEAEEWAIALAKEKEAEDGEE